MSIDAMKQALEAQIRMAGYEPVMQGECYAMHPYALQRVIDTALRLAIEQAEKQEPVANDLEPVETIRYWLDAYSNPNGDEHFMGHGMVVTLLREYLSLRETAPPQRQPLTEEEIVEGFCTVRVVHQYVEAFQQGVRFAERKHGIGGDK